MHTHLSNFGSRQSRRARSHLAGDLRALADHAEELLAATSDDLTEQAKETSARLRSVVDHIKETYGDWRDRGFDAAKVAASKTDAAVREYPYESLGIAFGLGLLVGILIRRR